MASPMQWAWIGQTPGEGEGQGGLVCCGPWGHRVGHDWAIEQQQEYLEYLVIKFQFKGRGPPSKDSKVWECIEGVLELKTILTPGSAGVKNPLANAGDIRDMGSIRSQEDHLKECMATHSSILAWRILWMEEPGELQPIGSQRVGHT